MADIATRMQSIPAMSAESIEKVRRLESVMKEMPQIVISTSHVIHGGMYLRTIMLPANTMLTGALIKIPTNLVVSGHATAIIGDEAITLEGYSVIPASAGRKQVFIAHSDTYITMSFPTSARTVIQAEREFTDETDLLLSHHDNASNLVTITGD